MKLKFNKYLPAGLVWASLMTYLVWKARYAKSNSETEEPELEKDNNHE